jgi:hypothetical protein
MTSLNDPGTELVPADHYNQPPPWTVRVRAAKWLPKVVNEPRPSVVDILEEAARPEPGKSEPRVSRVAWARFVAAPVKITTAVIDDLAEEPRRLLPAIVLLLLVGTVLNQVPIVSILIPSAIDLTTWF